MRMRHAFEGVLAAILLVLVIVLVIDIVGTLRAGGPNPNAPPCEYREATVWDRYPDSTGTLDEHISRGLAFETITYYHCLDGVVRHSVDYHAPINKK